MTANRPMWQRLRARLPMTIALAGVTAVWVFGCVWSFAEQRAYATAKRFGDPALFPLVLDGLAASMAGVAFAASLDGRPAVAARIGTALAVLASAASNGSWAAERSAYDPATIAMGVVMPIAANIAFEVLLGELRRQVQRGRGLPAPVAVPTLRLIRLVLAPWGTFTTWRRTVLDLTAMDAVASPSMPETSLDGGDPELARAPVPAERAPVPAVPLPEAVPAVRAPVFPTAFLTSSVEAPFDPPTVEFPPLTMLPGWPLPEPVPAPEPAPVDEPEPVEAGEKEHRYAALVVAVKAWLADPDKPRPTVRAVKAEHRVGTDIARQALREARA